MKRLALLLLPLLAACEEDEITNRGGPVIPVFWVDARTDNQVLGSFDRIQDACDFWNLPCEDSDDHEEAVILILTDHGGASSDGTHKTGVAYYDDCTPLLWSSDNGHSLEHEFGHGFSLRHVDDQENVMFSNVSIGGNDTTFDQHVTVAEHAHDRC